jgi:hypothetical protein
MTNEEIFVDAMIKQCSGGGGLTNQCKCGRFHFAGSKDDDYDENEFDDLMKKREEDPEHYIYDCESDCVSIVKFNGSYYVRGCVCGWEKRAADFLWSERAVIAEFLRMKRMEVMKHAIEVDEQLSDI